MPEHRAALFSRKAQKILSFQDTGPEIRQIREPGSGEGNSHTRDSGSVSKEQGKTSISKCGYTAKRQGNRPQQEDSCERNAAGSACKWRFPIPGSD